MSIGRLLVTPLVWCIRPYQLLISPMRPPTCRYYPSCSAYGLGSVQQRGLVVGSALTAWRIVRCNPWASGGIDDVRPARHGRYAITSFGWVVPVGMFPTAEADAAAARLAHAHAHDVFDGAPTTSSPTLSRKD